MTSGSAQIPLLVTMDLEIARDHELPEQAAILDRLGVELDRLGLPITIFATANSAVRFQSPLRELARKGHEIACHGLTHARSENYLEMSETTAMATIASATRQITAICGHRPTAFRGPFWMTSPATQQALLANGYESDFSVCAQRLDLLTARGASWEWLLAPRSPYHPSKDSPYRAGSMPLWAVPMRCLGAPFVSALLYLGGLPFVKGFFSTLLRESQKTNAPIVYLFHSYEFARRAAGEPSQSPLSHRLYIDDREERYQRNIIALEHMMRCKDVRPVRARELLS